MGSIALLAAAVGQAAGDGAPVAEAGGAEPAGLLTVVLLACVQGLAEFLPISSSGHLVLARIALGLREAGIALDVALHVGTLLATVWAYRAQVAELVCDVLAGRFGFFLWIVLATIPVGLVGAGLSDLLERAFQSERVAGAGLLFTSVMLLVGERARRANERRVAQAGPDVDPPTDPEREPRWYDALAIGGAQVLALVPGVSRSGTTIAAGMLRGFSGRQAARLSFMISIPAVLGAAVLEIPDALDDGFAGVGLGVVLVAVAVAAVVGWLALRGLLVTLARGAFRWFALYCAVVGTAVLFLT